MIGSAQPAPRKAPAKETPKPEKKLPTLTKELFNEMKAEATERGGGATVQDIMTERGYSFTKK
jgi:hypothetical protein